MTAMCRESTCGCPLDAVVTNGTGNAYAKAGSAQALTTSSTTAITTGLLCPGGSSDVKVKVENANRYAVKITTINANGTVTSDAGAACTASIGVTYADQSGSWTVADDGSPDAYAFVATRRNCVWVAEG